MDKSNLHDLLWQVPAEEVGRAFRVVLRQTTLNMILDVMAQEVTAVCGLPYHPREGASCRRAGSAPGQFVVDGCTEAVRRPRMRWRNAAGEEEEMPLVSYEAAQDAGAVREALLRAIAAGVSTRQAGRIFPGSPACSSSSVSRLWVEEGRKLFAVFRERDLSAESWFALMVDGVHLAHDLVAVVAVGLTVDGRKVVLDFELGASENFEACSRLLARLKPRGVTFTGPPLAILDGGDATAKAVRRHYPDTHIQRCLVHKERNIRGCLSRRHHGELALHFKLLRQAEGEVAARECLDALRRFLASHSHKAVESLDEAGDELITLHRLHAPSTLNRSLLSTNGIENIFHSARLKIDRVCRWRGTTDQPERWLAYALGEAEKGFHRIRGWRDIPGLLVGLKWPPDAIATARLRNLQAQVLEPRPKAQTRGARARTCEHPPSHVPQPTSNSPEPNSPTPKPGTPKTTTQKAKQP
jgi:transposase-like protein